MKPVSAGSSTVMSVTMFRGLPQFTSSTNSTPPPVIMRVYVADANDRRASKPCGGNELLRRSADFWRWKSCCLTCRNINNQSAVNHAGPVEVLPACGLVRPPHSNGSSHRISPFSFVIPLSRVLEARRVRVFMCELDYTRRAKFLPGYDASSRCVRGTARLGSVACRITFSPAQRWAASTRAWS